MADQLNYVLNNFEFEDEKNYYFSVYNADSIPNKNTIKEVFETINKNDDPKVIQQYSVSISNWNELSNLMKGFSIYQSNFELRYGIINSYFPNELLYTYVVGHGMYIRVMHLKNWENIQHLNMQCGQYEKLFKDRTLLQPDEYIFLYAK